MRGYDRDEVTAFLAEVAADYEAALQEADKMRQESTWPRGRIDLGAGSQRPIPGTRRARRRTARRPASHGDSRRRPQGVAVDLRDEDVSAIAVPEPFEFRAKWLPVRPIRIALSPFLVDQCPLNRRAVTGDGSTE